MQNLQGSQGRERLLRAVNRFLSFLSQGPNGGSGEAQQAQAQQAQAQAQQQPELSSRM